ncbi:hypothetical protein [uncultured Methanobrevibacter sp.]|uniref:hypothetical protein n=1 Tax=uncultured Methanobrevibacter sp. TaxID=253161 RepID=UPI0025FFE076|nr:hypothetical protein [uncultured Methanobrevibacter sp.]
MGKAFEKDLFKHSEKIPYEFDRVYEQDTFEETLEEVKNFNPLLIVPGNERGLS